MIFKLFKSQKSYISFEMQNKKSCVLIPSIPRIDFKNIRKKMGRKYDPERYYKWRLNIDFWILFWHINIKLIKN